MSAIRQHRPLVTAAAFIIVVAGMRAAQPILVPFLLSLFIAIIAVPLMTSLKQRGVPEWLALVGVLGSVAVVGALLVSLIGTSVQSFSSNLPKYGERLEVYQASLAEKIAPIHAFIEGLADVEPNVSEDGATQPEDGDTDPFTTDLSAPDGNTAAEAPFTSLLTQIDVKQWGLAALRTAAGTFAGLTGVLTNTFLIFLTVIFILLEASGFPTKLKAALGDDPAPMERLTRMSETVNRYMALKTGVSLLTGVLAASFLAIIGVDYALLWGLLAFFLNYIPNIGSILAAIPPVLLALIQFGPGKALAVILAYVALNMGIGNVLEPRLMGKGLGLSTLVVFLSLVFWGWVLGPVGMLLSVPLTMALKIGLESDKETRWIAIILGSEAAAKHALAADAATARKT